MTADNGAGASDRLQRKRQSSSANEALIVYLTGTRALDLAGGVRRQVWNRGVIARLTVGPGVDDFWTSHNDADWWNRSETDGGADRRRSKVDERRRGVTSSAGTEVLIDRFK